MKAAASLGCYHTCPAYDGDTPHQGGVIVKGSESVFFENRPAARVGDLLTCQSSSADVIIKGSDSVFINGKPLARLGDNTQHGGTISEGLLSIFIG